MRKHFSTRMGDRERLCGILSDRPVPAWRGLVWFFPLLCRYVCRGMARLLGFPLPAAAHCRFRTARQGLFAGRGAHAGRGRFAPC